MKWLPGIAVPLMLLWASNWAHGAVVVCDAGSRTAAAANARSLETLSWTPMGRQETGWQTYAPLIADEIGTGCSATSPGFAAALADWQEKHDLPGRGIIDSATFTLMKQVWQARRPFVAISHLACPPPPDESRLAVARADESYDDKQVRLLPDALAAYRKMVAAAHAQLLAAAANRKLLTIFSGYRSPAYDAARCARQNNCQGLVRAACSPHRTGLAMDIYLGAAAGYGPDSSADANRLYLSGSQVYRWLVYNAWRFGFENYVFEPWHWEWTGAPSHSSQQD